LEEDASVSLGLTYPEENKLRSVGFIASMDGFS